MQQYLAILDQAAGQSVHSIERVARCHGLAEGSVLRVQKKCLVQYLLSSRRAYSDCGVLCASVDASRIGTVNTFSGMVQGRAKREEVYLAAWLPPQAPLG